MTFANKKKDTKNVYILCIYTVKGTKLQMEGVYPMGILWIWYGYPMV